MGEVAKWSSEHARARDLVLYLPSALTGEVTDLNWQQVERHASRIEATSGEYVELLREVARLGLVGLKETKEGVRITLRTPQETSEAPP
jgi:hypothetical protein